MSGPDTGRSATVQVSHKTRSMLKILLHTTFPIAISDCFFRDATTEVTSSGAEVPNATIVKPITDSDTQKLAAIFLAELTRKSAHRVNQISPKNTYNIDLPTKISSIFVSVVSSLDDDFAIQKVYEKNSIKNNKNTKLSPLVIISRVPHEKNESKARNNSANEAIREKGTSLNIVECFACNGYTRAATPRTSQVFAIFEPITFHSASSVCHLIAESIFTNNSGADVPNATIVKPITSGEIPNLFAKLEAHVTNISAHLMSTINPITRNI